MFGSTFLTQSLFYDKVQHPFIAVQSLEKTVMALPSVMLKLKSKNWLQLEVAILVITLVIIWILLSLPVVFFYIPKVS